MRYFIFISLSALLLSLSSCIPDPVEIEIPQAEPKLVVASQMLFDRILLVQVSRSFGALEFSEEASDTLSQELLDQILVPRARVVLTHAGRTDTLIPIDAGVYVGFNTLLIPGQTYQLSVYDSTTEEQVFAESEVLPSVQWGSVRYSFDADSLSFGGTTFLDTTLAVEVAFDDLPGDNYYMVNLYRISLDSGRTASLFGNALTGGSQPTFAISDQLYNSSSIVDTLYSNNFRQGDTIAVALSHISEQYYQYLTTRERSNGSIFVSLLGEPVSYPSNVEGGYGMFNLHLPSLGLIFLE